MNPGWCECYNTPMVTKSDLTYYRERWKAVEEVEKIGLARYNLLARLIYRLGIKSDKNVEKVQIILRWAKLKEVHEQRRD